MRAGLGLVGVLLVLAIAGQLVRVQLGTQNRARVAPAASAASFAHEVQHDLAPAMQKAADAAASQADAQH